MPKIIRFQPGERLAYATVIRLVEDFPSAENRLYLIRAECCGTEYVRTHAQLRDLKRRERKACVRCRYGSGTLRLQTAAERQERFGPVVIVGRIGETHVFTVRWDCCGRESEMNDKRLLRLRHLAANGYIARCRKCQNESMTGVPAANRIYTRAAPKPPKEDFPVYHSGGGELPAGIIPAAIAWPRPGVRA